MSKYKDSLTRILLNFLNSDSGFKEVPSEYVIYIDDPEFPESVKYLLDAPELDDTQKQKLRDIILVNEILIHVKNEEPDKVEENL